MKENQTSFWEIHFPNSKEREEAQSIYKRLSEMFPEKEKALSFIRRLEKCAYLESIDCKEKSRSEKIARIVSKLPETEQDKIYYMIKGIELAGANRHDSASRAAV